MIFHVLFVVQGLAFLFLSSAPQGKEPGLAVVAVSFVPPPGRLSAARFGNTGCGNPVAERLGEKR